VVRASGEIELPPSLQTFSLCFLLFLFCSFTCECVWWREMMGKEFICQRKKILNREVKGGREKRFLSCFILFQFLRYYKGVYMSSWERERVRLQGNPDYHEAQEPFESCILDSQIDHFCLYSVLVFHNFPSSAGFSSSCLPLFALHCIFSLTSTL